jgi:hypothetical protein
MRSLGFSRRPQVAAMRADIVTRSSATYHGRLTEIVEPHHTPDSTLSGTHVPRQTSYDDFALPAGKPINDQLIDV